MLSTGTPDAVKVARPVWMRGKSASSYLCIRNLSDDNEAFTALIVRRDISPI
jgi:hypothetical protein